MKFCIKLTVLLVGLCCLTLVFAAPASAQLSGAQQPSEAATQHAARVAEACPGQWSSSACLTAVSESTLVLAANYAGKLQAQGKTSGMDELKDHCAAATAAAQGDYPANAMTSAYTECANNMYEVSQTTGVEPDLSHYQLLVGAVLCLNKDRRCDSIEQQLMKY